LRQDDAAQAATVSLKTRHFLTASFRFSGQAAPLHEGVTAPRIWLQSLDRLLKKAERQHHSYRAGAFLYAI
jgi:hypothetical protein